MNDVIRILSHAVRMVFADFGQTLRATATGVVLIAIATVLVVTLAPDPIAGVLTGDDATGQSPQGDTVGLTLLAVVLMVIGYVLMIVSWHRYVLLSEAEREGGFTPGAGIVLGYIGRSILIGLILIAAAIPVLTPVAMIGAAVASLPAGLMITGIAAIPAIAVLGWLILRLSLILPACAIAKPLTISESWAASRPMSATIFGLAVALGLIDFVLNTVQTAVFPGFGVTAAIIAAIISLLFALVSTSIVTTLYGILIEKRTL